ncbi:serine/threonine protein kinase, negative regulator of sexual conjugation and meiosis [Mycena floridula]|nr:serine/threonine protein kinase, negative regulator of sexual conjugation and meiosis [Mycena floridula]
MTDSFPDFSGQTIDGRYQLLALIGAGAFGKVYKAIDLCDNTMVAIKCMAKPEPGSRAELYQNREFALHNKVGCHRNIIDFRRHFTASHEPDSVPFVFVVLALCDGGDLLRAVRSSIFTDARIKTTMLQIIDSVEYCHRNTVFHRDLKPENILINKDGTIFLADFGLATDEHFVSEFGCGTLHYMSPECVGGKPGQKYYSTMINDLWAVGVILANLMTRDTPWRVAHIQDPFYAAFLDDANALRHSMDIAPAAMDILRGLLHPDSFSRTSLQELRNQIVEIDSFFKPKKTVYGSRNPFCDQALYQPNPVPSPRNPFVLFGSSQGVTRVTVGSISAQNLFSVGDISSGSSSGSSAFPVTPESNPFEPLLSVQEMSEGQNIGSSIVKPVIRLPKLGKGPPGDVRPPKRKGRTVQVSAVRPSALNFQKGSSADRLR